MSFKAKFTELLQRQIKQSLQDARDKAYEADPSSKAARSVDRKIQDFITLTEHFPGDIFTLDVSVYEQTPPGRVLSLRGRHDTLRGTFYKNAADHYRSAFKAMGLNNDMISMIAQGWVPIHPEGGWYYDLSFDHVVDLSRGGSAEQDNLVIVPRYVNNLRERLYSLQISEAVVPQYVLTLQYKEAEKRHALVPYIPGGFRQDIVDPVVFSERMAPLFGGRGIAVNTRQLPQHDLVREPA
jgi:hypothetical protein